MLLSRPPQNIAPLLSFCPPPGMRTDSFLSFFESWFLLALSACNLGSFFISLLVWFPSHRVPSSPVDAPRPPFFLSARFSLRYAFLVPKEALFVAIDLSWATKFVFDGTARLLVPTSTFPLLLVRFCLGAVWVFYEAFFSSGMFVFSLSCSFGLLLHSFFLLF